MIRKSKLYAISILSILLFSSFVVALRWLPISRINELSIVPEYRTESVMRILLPALSGSFNRLPIDDMKKALNSLSYVESAELLYENGNLNANIVFSEKAILISDGNEFFLFRDGELLDIDKGDYSALSKRYIPLTLDSAYLSYLKRYGLDSGFERILSTLMLLDDYSALITKAEYDNNKTTGKGSLILHFDNLNAELHIADGVQGSRIKESIEAIAEESRNNPGETLFSERAIYELRLSELVRIKR